MEDEKIYAVIEGREAMLKNPFYRTPSKNELAQSINEIPLKLKPESVPGSDNPSYEVPSKFEPLGDHLLASENRSKNPSRFEPESYEIPLKLDPESASAADNPSYEAPSKFDSFLASANRNKIPSKLKPQEGMLSSENACQTKSKYKKSVCGCSILLVGFILVGSAAFVSMSISLWAVSRVSLSILKLEMITTEFYASKAKQTMEFQAFKNNMSEQIMELINNISEHYMEFQVSKHKMSEQIMKFKASKNNISKEIIGLQASNNNKSEQIMGLQAYNNNISIQIKEFQISNNNLHDKIMELNNASDEKITNIRNSVHVINKQLSNISRSLDSKLNKLIKNEQYDSCSHVLQLNPSSPSSHYWIRSYNGSAVRVYCDFNRQCGCDGPSTWTRVAFLDMSDPNQVCPRNWTIFSTPVRCSRKKIGKGCDSVFYSTFGLTYSRVCGRIIGYQMATTDGFQELVTHGLSIDGQYVDGVSLTHGSVGSRQHIWSFASAIGEATRFKARYVCDCSNNNNWPYNTSFVGNDYFCDSGNPYDGISHSRFYSSDPLWDGQGCGPSSTCCQFNNPPWFCKTLPQPTTDDLEIRICNDANHEDTPVQLVELYVQ